MTWIGADECGVVRPFQAFGLLGFIRRSAMYLEISKRLMLLVGRTCMILAMWTVVPLASGETTVEGEALATVSCTSPQVVEACGQCVSHGKCSKCSELPGQRLSPISYVGHEGRRLYALSIPLRC